MTFEYKRLREDGNIKGLYVCDEGCYDYLDVYKLPPAPPDSFVLHHPRPDLPLNDVPNYVLDNDGNIVYGDDGFPIINS
jgi:hypothetical protein